MSPDALERASDIARELGLDQHGLRVSRTGGGDIAQSVVVQAADAWVFVKFLPLGRNAILSSEADGLQALHNTRTVRVPRVIKRGTMEDRAWLALEYLDLDERTAHVDRRLGEQLAALHRHTADAFGWHRNNYLGLTPQPNEATQDWTHFFLTHRLGYQFDRLHQQLADSKWRDLKDAIACAWVADFAGHEPPPALIHGDLWRGNAGALGQAQPVIFDPAVHYADRECDLAMTRLFGGFSPDFYGTYESAWPLPEGHERRRLYYKLYHVLNHANMFGGSYLRSAAELGDRILAAH